MNSRSRLKILIAAGGSGGHIFPAVALAKRLKDRERNVDIKFVGSNRYLDKKILKNENFDFFYYRPINCLINSRPAWRFFLPNRSLT